MRWLGAAIGAVSIVWLSDLAVRGPMRHAIAGTLHLAGHPRPTRFGNPKAVAALTPLDLGGARLGAETSADFTWNRLVGFDACVECGRCELACPAFAAGQPLNPKKLIQDLANSLSPAGAVVEYSGSAHPGRPHNPRSLARRRRLSGASSRRRPYGLAPPAVPAFRNAR